MSKITPDMIRVFNQRLAGNGSPWRIVESEYDGAGYSQQTIVGTVDPTLAPMLVDQVTYTNGTDLEQQVTLKVEKSLKLTHSFSFKNEWKIGTSGKLSFKVGVVDVEATLSLDYTREETTTDTSEETFTLSFEQPLKVPAKQIVTMQTLIQLQTVTDMPFELDVVLRDGSFGVVPKDTVPVYRYAGSNDHFYTANYDELRDGNSDYAAEGIACHVSSTPGMSMIPMYRYLHSDGQHFYTTDPREPGDDFTSEGLLGYVYPSQAPGTVPLYRYFHDEAGHFYTTEYAELGGGRDGWRSEGIQAYVIPRVLTDPALLRRVQELFPVEADRKFVIAGKYRGQSTNRRIDVLLTEQPLPMAAASRARGKQLVQRATDRELLKARALAGPQVVKVSPGQLVDLTKKRRSA